MNSASVQRILITAVLLFITVTGAFAQMKEPGQVEFAGRKGWKLSNGKLEIIVLTGGGHIVSAKLLGKDEPTVNPYWVPQWKSMEPQDFDTDRDGRVYGDNIEGKLLAGLMGHSICLDFFGVPSEAEYKNGGITVHGEAPVAEWKVVKTWGGADETGITYGADLPKSMLHIERTVVLKKGEQAARITEKLTNKGYFDRPFGWCQHVTLGAPFVKGGITVFDTPAMRSAVAPFEFSKKMRYKMGAEYRWPYAPGSDGSIKMARVAADEEASSDYSAHLMDTNFRYGYFTAANPKEGLLMGYVWDRKTFPWLDNWEENRARTHIPWSGKETTRGMEFSNTPWTYTRKGTVEEGKFFGTPTYAWIEAGKSITTEYVAFFNKIPKNYRGTEMLKLDNKGIEIIRFNGEKMTIPCFGVEKLFK